MNAHAQASVSGTHVADLLEAYAAGGGDPGQLIVIGGAAVETWVGALSDQDDAFAEESLQTWDVDFQVREIAIPRRFADIVGGRLIEPEQHHSTPELAKLIVPGWGGLDQNLELDFLPGPLDLNPEQVEKRSRKLQVETSSGRVIDIRVIHPAHALMALALNYIRLPAKRKPWTLARIDAMIEIVRRYIVAVAQIGEQTTTAGQDGARFEKDARWSMQYLLRSMAKQGMADFHLREGKDFLQAIPSPEEAPVTSAFWEREYPALVAAVTKRRNASANRVASTVKR